MKYEKLYKITFNNLDNNDIVDLIEEHGVICLTDFFNNNDQEKLKKIYNELENLIPNHSKRENFNFRAAGT
jgi:hypothetical protein